MPVAPRVTSKNPLHVVLIADDSGSMAGTPAQEVTEGVRDFVSLLQSNCKDKSRFRLTLIKFGDMPHRTHEFADILQVNANDFEVTGGSGQTNMDRALELAAQTIEGHRPQSELDPSPLVIFWSDGQNTGGDPLTAAQRIKSFACPCGRTPLLVTCGFGSAERQLLEGMATSPEHYKELRNAEELRNFLGVIGTTTATAGSMDQVRESIKPL